MDPQQPDRASYPDAIRSSGLTIYDEIAVGDPKLWIPTPALERLLDGALAGASLAGLPLRTRSRKAKEYVCAALGYPQPKSFKRTQPRFVGQKLDVVVQNSDNLQIWNDELAPTRRYALLRLSIDGRVAKVRVVTGDDLLRIEATGKLTSKYQARFVPGESAAELFTPRDTEALVAAGVSARASLGAAVTPVSAPREGELLSIAAIFGRLVPLLGHQFIDAGIDQERNRGAALHRLVCSALGYNHYRDSGQYPDIRHQLLEVKLQTAPTIDLGLVLPSDPSPLGVPPIGGRQIRFCDVRYAVFYGRTLEGSVKLTHLVMTTGASFFNRFPQCQGRQVNAKLQIPLPPNFFSSR